MLYQIYETQRALMEPFVDFAQATAKVINSSNLPFVKNELTQRVAAGYDLLYRLGKDYEKPTFGITEVEANGHQIAIQEREAIYIQLCACKGIVAGVSANDNLIDRTIAAQSQGVAGGHFGSRANCGRKT